MFSTNFMFSFPEIEDAEDRKPVLFNFSNLSVEFLEFLSLRLPLFFASRDWSMTVPRI